MAVHHRTHGSRGRAFGAGSIHWVLGLALAPALARAQSPFAPLLVHGWTSELTLEGLARPTDLRVGPDGSLWIAEQAGRVLWFPPSGGDPQVVLDLSAEVLDWRDLGLVALALHPNFLPDGGDASWLYALYAVDPAPPLDLPNGTDQRASFGRLSRWRVGPSALGPAAIPSSREVLLGEQLPDGRAPTALALLHESHQGGGLAFGRDGSLLVSTGDGANYTAADTGGLQPFGFDHFVHPVDGLRGPLPSNQDLGAFRASSLESLAGKVLRLDPETGLGLADNPFWSGDPDSVASRVYALGLRNPFRLAVQPGPEGEAKGPGTLLVGDVGALAREELNRVAAGAHFGWPCIEGLAPHPDYQGGQGPLGCPPPLLPLSSPLLAWTRDEPAELWPLGAHQSPQGSQLFGFTGFCAVGGEFLSGPRVAAPWQGAYLFADYGGTWVRALWLDGGGALERVQDVGALFFGPVALRADPERGGFWVLERGYGPVLGSLRRVVPADHSPWNLLAPLGLAGDGLYLAIESEPQIASALAVRAFGAPKAGPGVLAAGRPLEQALSLGTVSLWVDPLGPGVLVPLAYDGSGIAHTSLAVPAVGALWGFHLAVQAFGLMDPVPGGLAASHGLSAVLGSP